ncbi:hypothetical protein JXA63_02295 [Candidatus Woesebacteria bacterium]|nr:hypothetical protein [Candidatus Woesebacteria bacterium]
MSAQKTSAQGCGQRCWFPPDTTHCDPGLSCAPGAPPETRVCWAPICESGGGDPTPTPIPLPTNTPIPTATPTPLPPCEIRMYNPEYKCNDDGTAEVTWNWDPKHAADKYLLQISLRSDFNPLDTETLQIDPGNNTGKPIGATEHYTNISVNSPEVLRFARVKVDDLNMTCATGGGWDWGNTVSTLRDCTDNTAEPQEPTTTSILDDFFCDSSGRPTDRSDTGEIFTAIGCVPADEFQDFTEFSARWSVGIAGGIALLMIIYSGYLYMTSQGNPQKIQSAKELITAAIGGLLFLIFSATILRTVYENILRL